MPHCTESPKWLARKIQTFTFSTHAPLLSSVIVGIRDAIQRNELPFSYESVVCALQSQDYQNDDLYLYLAQAPLQEILVLILYLVQHGSPKDAIQQLTFTAGHTRILCLQVETWLSQYEQRPELAPYAIIRLEVPQLCRMVHCLSVAAYALTLPHTPPLEGTYMYPICQRCASISAAKPTYLQTKLQLIVDAYQQTVPEFI